MHDTTMLTETQSPSPVSRRGLLQAGAALLATPLMLGGLSGMGLAASSERIGERIGETTGGTATPASLEDKNRVDLPLMRTKRTLGTGAYSLEVSALGFGVMGGNMTEYTRFDSGNDNRNTLPRFTPEALRANLLYMETLHRFGRPRGVTGAQVALAWMLAKKDWIVPIPGTTKLSHLEENLRAADLVCTPQEWAELEHSLAQVRIVAIGIRRSSKSRCSVRTRCIAGPLPSSAWAGGLSQLAYISLRWVAEQPFVFALKLVRAFIAHGVAGPCGVASG